MFQISRLISSPISKLKTFSENIHKKKKKGVPKKTIKSLKRKSLMTELANLSREISPKEKSYNYDKKAKKLFRSQR
jgi:hypothetical protein